MKLFRIVAVAVLTLVTVISIFILNRPESSDTYQNTDDAYVRADFTTVAPQVSGVVSHVYVSDNQQVKAGSPLVRIDDQQFRISVRQSKADVLSAKAAIESLRAQNSKQDSVIQQARATLAASEAQLNLAANDKQRYVNLAKDGSVSVQARQQAVAQWGVQKAAFERDSAALTSAIQEKNIISSDIDKAVASLTTAEAHQSEAELNLSRTNIHAPGDGIVTQRRAREGSYVSVGDPLVTLVPINALYVEANYRETQIEKMRPGQTVTMKIDALPGVVLEGKIESLGPASGVSYSQIPPHNATGNFTKIVQRLPVRILFDKNQDALKLLRVGMSVTTRIKTDS